RKPPAPRQAAGSTPPLVHHFEKKTPPPLLIEWREIDEHLRGRTQTRHDLDVHHDFGRVFEHSVLLLLWQLLNLLRRWRRVPDRNDLHLGKGPPHLLAKAVQIAFQVRTTELSDSDLLTGGCPGREVVAVFKVGTGKRCQTLERLRMIPPSSASGHSPVIQAVHAFDYPIKLGRYLQRSFTAPVFA